MLGNMSRLLGRAKVHSPPWEGPFNTTATADDIVACFRLLLGRKPNLEEWRGHSSRAGEDLAGVVASYVGSLEFARRNLLAPGLAGEAALAELPGFRIYTAPDDAAVGRHVGAGSYEPDVSAVFRRVLRPGMGVIDIGANIGYFSMLSASLVGPEGLVVAVEPNGANARMLEASRRVNGFENIVVVQAAAGPEVGMLVLHRSHSNGTTSALPDDAAALLRAESVACVPVDLVLPPGRRFELIKADVEGAEFKALSGCREVIARDRPIIVSEFSPGMMPGISGISGEEYLRWIMGLGYGVQVVQPDGSLGTDGSVAAVMAAYAGCGGDHIDILATPVP